MGTPSEELRRRIVADLNAGVPGAKLGSERELAERYGTSRSSLRQMLAALEEAGLVHRAIGRAGGIFISHAQVQRSLSDVVGVPAFLANQGYVAGTRVLSTKITVAGSDHADRRCASAPMTSSSRSSASGWPTAPPSRWSWRSFRPTRFQGCSRSSSAARSTKSWKPTTVSSPPVPTSGSRPSTPPRTRPPCWPIKPQSALLLITRITYDQHGVPCEFSRDLFRGDRTRLAVTVNGRGIGAQPSVGTATVALQRQEADTKAS